MKIKKKIRFGREIHTIEGDMEECESAWRTLYMKTAGVWRVDKSMHVYCGFLGLGMPRFRFVVSREVNP